MSLNMIDHYFIFKNSGLPGADAYAQVVLRQETLRALAGFNEFNKKYSHLSIEGETVRYSTDRTQDGDIQEIVRLFSTGEANTVEVLGIANQQFIDNIVHGLTSAGFIVEKTQDNAMDTVYIKLQPVDPVVVEEVKKIVYEIIEDEWKRNYEEKLGVLGTKSRGGK